MLSPYENLPRSAYWKTGVVQQDWTALYRKKFAIAPDMRIMTAGSCFAQNITRYMRARNYKVIDTEPAPRGLTGAAAKTFGYELYSARYGNIYTVRQLLQLAREAFGRFEPADAIWTKDGRYYDALRPSVEPEGLESEAEVVAQRRDHLAQVRAAFEKSDLFIFTFGLTEGWVHKKSGTVYPTAPGTIAGTFDPKIYEFQNFSVAEVHNDFVRFRRLLKGQQKLDLKFLVTVSPVPLTATASQNHVLPASVYSKSVLRAAAGQLVSEFEDVDYFPAYEMVATSFFQQDTFEDNLRSVRSGAIDKVMDIFFREHGGELAARKQRAARAPSSVPREADDDVVCEEMLLESFAG